MKNYTIYIIIGCVIIGGGFFYFLSAQKSDTVQNIPNTDTRTEERDRKEATAVAHTGVSIDLSLCTIQQEKVYLCPANALSDFGPIVVKNEGQTNTCTISYSKDTGFTFNGAVKTGEVSSGDFLASVTDEGNVANIIRNSTTQSLSFFLGGGNRIIHIQFVDMSDYSRDQCIEL